MAFTHLYEYGNDMRNHKISYFLNDHIGVYENIDACEYREILVGNTVELLFGVYIPATRWHSSHL